jgi:hypothetical protein
VQVLWQAAQTPGKIFEYRIPGPVRRTLWQPASAMEGWTGDLTAIAVRILGGAGDELTLGEVALLPATLQRRLSALYSDWTTFIPWQQYSINAYTGVRSRASPFYPAPILTALWVLSMVAYGAILCLPWVNARFEWRVAATIFLTCWIGLDLLWQGKLVRQLGITYATFYGKSPAQQLAAGPDAELVAFMTDVAHRVEPSGSRIFVHSQDDYLGMRGAYYLYPLNVYWNREDPELPHRHYLHSGDHIVLIEPAVTGFDPLKKTLATPGGAALRVQPLISRRMGTLFRVE